jgi:hypothetical protein
MNARIWVGIGVILLIALVAKPLAADTQIGNWSIGQSVNAPQTQWGLTINPDPCRVLVVMVGLHDGTENERKLDWVRWDVGPSQQYLTRVNERNHNPGGVNIEMWAVVNPAVGTGTITAWHRQAGAGAVAAMSTVYWNAQQRMPVPQCTGMTWDKWEVYCNTSPDGGQNWLTGATPGSMLAYFTFARSTAGNWEPYDHHTRWTESELADWVVSNCEASGGYAFFAGTEWPVEIAFDSGSSNKVLTAAAIPPVQTPTVTLQGFNPIVVQCHTAYTEPGYTATDGAGTDITSCCVNVSSNVNVNVPGDYSITYSVPCGNGASAIRIVQVRDTIAPSVTITNPPGKAIYAECKVPFDMGSVAVSASDACDGAINSSTVVTNWGTFNPWAPEVGTHYISYTATDAAGNIGTDTLTAVVQDTQKPLISVVPDSVPVECGTAYTEAMARQGVSCTDSCNGDLSAGIVITGATFPITASGTYILTYNKFDLSGNAADPKTRTVVISDTQAPVITDTGQKNVLLECPASYSLSDAQFRVAAVDTCEGDMSALIDVRAYTEPGEVEVPFPVAAVGAYTIRYNIADSTGNAAAEVRRDLVIQDTTAASWTLPGDIAITNAEAPFTEAQALAGVQALDACAGPLTVTVEALEWNVGPVPFPIVDPGVPYPRIYSLIYTADDGNGNVTTNDWRSLFMLSEFPLGITIMGENPTTVECHSPYTGAQDQGAVAFDPSYGDYTDQIQTTGLPVNTNVLGPHVVTYSVTIGGTYYEEQRVVNVEDSQPPSITLNRGSSLRIGVGAAYVDPGAIALDACDGDLSTQIVVSGDTVDTSMPAGTIFQVFYNVSDSQGNAAIQRMRTVELLVDTSPPDLQLIGPAEVQVSCGAGYVEPGYIATDPEEGDLTPDVVITGGPLNAMTPPGTYTLRYNVSDHVGQTAPERTRTVVVLEDCPLYVEYIGETDAPHLMRKTIVAGDDYTFAVRAHEAIGAVSYQWLKSDSSKAWSPILDAEEDSFTLANLHSSDAGMYMCVVTDAVTVAESPELEFIVQSGLPASTSLGLVLTALATALAGAAIVQRRKGATE